MEFLFCAFTRDIWVRSRRWGCLVTWFCYQLIAKPGNKTAAPSWPDPCESVEWALPMYYQCLLCWGIFPICKRVFFWYDQGCIIPTGYINGLVQDCSFSTANACGLLQLCTKPSIWHHNWSFMTILYALTLSLVILSGHNFAHIQTTQLSWYLQICAMIWW